MIWYVCFAVAVLAMAAGIAAAAIQYFGNHMRGRVLTPFHLIVIGVFVSVFVCMLPIYGAILAGSQDRVLKTIAFSLHHTLQTFTLDADREIIQDCGLCPVTWLSVFYSGFLSIAFIVAPILTFGFLLSFFRNVSAYAGYLLRFFRDVYVFSELNEKSLALGADIKRNHKRALIVYTDVFDNNDEVSSECIERARVLHAILFKKDILSINFKAHYGKAQIVFFTIGEDETENINQSLKLIERYRQREHTRLFVFSSRVDGELLLTKADKGKMKVRRVNEIRSLIDRILYESGESLFRNANLLPNGDKQISAVIVGLGRCGTEMLKALSWYCQMDGYHVEIDVYDADEKAEDRFRALAPELMAKAYNGVAIPGEAEYTIRIHSGVDVGTQSFADEIGRRTGTTFAFVSLGSDEMNIKTAVELRMLFERMRIRPVIQAIVFRSEERKALSDVTNYCGQPYGIEFVGDLETSYSEAVILNSELEAAALRRHMKWGKEEEFWQYEYNYNSSVAAALHLRARVACGIPGADKREEELSTEERTTIERLEHRRWNAYMRSEGYVYSGSPDKNSCNDLAKMHHDLVDYASLTDEEKRKDSRVGLA
ncbi:MAG: hypothetical protein IKZ44_00855 [Clostridia bacterium]|nr:hypothetical protein [Clostridia bacterium]